MRLTICFAALLGTSAFLVRGICIAQIVEPFRWKDPSDGDYHNIANWTMGDNGLPAGRIPNSTDRIVLDQDWVYSVYVNRPANAGSLEVSKGDVTLHLAGPMTAKLVQQHGPSSLTLAGGTMNTADFTSSLDASVQITNGELNVTSGLGTVVESFDVGPNGSVKANKVVSFQGRAAQKDVDVKRSQIAIHDNSTLDASEDDGALHTSVLRGMVDLLVDNSSSVRFGPGGFFETYNDCGSNLSCETFLRLSNHSWFDSGRIVLGAQGTARMIVEDSEVASTLGLTFSEFDLGQIALNASGKATLELRGASTVSGFPFISVRPGSSLRLTEKVVLPFNSRPRIEGGVALEPNSLLSGSGDIIGQVINSGIIDAGTLNVSEYFEQSDGTLRVMVVGNTPNQYSRIVTSSAILAGRLEVSFGGGYRPEVGDRYNIISGGQLSGAFSSIRGFDRELRGVPLSGGKVLMPIYSATGLSLSVEERCGASCEFKKSLGPALMPVLAEVIHLGEKADAILHLVEIAAAVESGGGSAVVGGIISKAVPRAWLLGLVGRIVADPPDPDFRTLAMPSEYVPDRSALDGVSVALRTALINQEEGIRGVGYDMAALFHTTEKLSGAIESGDVEWEMAQDRHFMDLLLLLRDDLASLVDSAEQLAGEIEDIPGVDALITEAILQSVRDLPSSALIDSNSLEALATSLEAAENSVGVIRSVSLEEVRASPIRELFAAEIDTWRNALSLVHAGVNGAIAGDANRDGTVSLDDFAILKANFGQNGEWIDGDFGGDGRVGLSDFGVLKANFGNSSAVPEASTWSLAALAAIGFTAIRVGAAHARRRDRYADGVNPNCQGTWLTAFR